MAIQSLQKRPLRNLKPDPFSYCVNYHYYHRYSWREEEENKYQNSPVANKGLREVELPLQYHYYSAMYSSVGLSAAWSQGYEGIDTPPSRGRGNSNGNSRRSWRSWLSNLMSRPDEADTELVNHRGDSSSYSHHHHSALAAGGQGRLVLLVLALSLLLLSFIASFSMRPKKGIPHEHEHTLPSSHPFQYGCPALGPAPAGQRYIQIQNQCLFTIWPALLGDSDAPPVPPPPGGWAFPSGDCRTLTVSSKFPSMRLWGRTGCDMNFACVTGGCEVDK